jgi:hypothetical protein
MVTQKPRSGTLIPAPPRGSGAPGAFSPTARWGAASFPPLSNGQNAAADRWLRWPPAVQLWAARGPGLGEMNSYTLAKLVMLTIVLILAIVRLDVDRHNGCKANCPTEISAQRR